MALTASQKNFLLDDLIPALRSGEYVQGRGYLNRNFTYCCLGVFVDRVIEAEKVPGLSWVSPDLPSDSHVLGVPSDADDMDVQTASLPHRVAEVIFGAPLVHGPHVGPMASYQTFRSTLAGHNDYGEDFGWIADRLTEWAEQQDIVEEADSDAN